MSLFFRKPEVRSHDEGGWFGVGDDSPSTKQATHLVPVFAALRHIVDYVSTLPADYYWKNLDGTRSPAPTPELARRLEVEGAGVGAWFGQAAYALATDGNAVGWVSDVNGFGHPTRVHWLGRNDWTFDEIRKQWYVSGHPVPSSRIRHIPWIVPPGKTLGLSPIEHYAATINAGLSAQEYADMKRGGGIPPTTLKNEAQTLDAEQAERISRRLAQKFANGRPFVHGKDWTFGTVTIPPNHAHFIETMKLTANQIAAIYGVDPVEIGGEASNSQEYSNEEMRQIKRAANMRPYLTRLEDAVSRMLSGREHVRFNLDAIVRVDLKTSTEVFVQEVTNGIRSVNEVRAIKDLPPVKGGDHYNVPAPTAAPTIRGNEGDTP